MIQNGHLTIEQRNCILGHVQAGTSPGDVSKLFGVSKRAVLIADYRLTTMKPVKATAFEIGVSRQTILLCSTNEKVEMGF